MQLETGSKLGHYEILSSLGAGGMGEVYRAKDTKLGREVAIKLLLEEVSADPERMARFEREARVLASLNHNNIATLHGFEKEGDTSFLVMEVVEGETLADRIKRGAIPVDEALPIFLQIAEGLEAAHEKGVIHRDLKPANIKVTDDGNVKILDFGLAKAMASEIEMSDASVSMSPTLTLAATQRGEILGTVAYMSPEQASGKPVDKRTDLWSFGLCLWEALTGRRVFEGEDAPNTLAAVLRDDIDFSDLPHPCPPSVRRLLERCLARNRRDRLHDIADARLELQQALDELADPSPKAKQAPASGLRPARSWVLGASALVLAGAIAGWTLKTRPEPPPRPTSRFTFSEPGMMLDDPLRLWLRLSPDGRTVLYNARDDDAIRLYARSLDELESRPIRGTEGSLFGIYLADGESILFDQEGPPRVLKKIPASGGPGLTVAPTLALGTTWGPDDTVIMGSAIGLVSVPSDGGEVRTLVEPGFSMRDPFLLPGERAILFHSPTDSGLEVGVYSLDSDEIRFLLPGRSPRYARSGHLVFMRENALWAVPFDVESLEIRGAPVPVVEGVQTDQTTRNYDLRAGTLVYGSAGSLAASGSRLVVWLDREGREEVVPLRVSGYFYPRISPEGDRFGVTDQSADGDVWIWHMRQKRLTRLTFEPGADIYSTWTPDGRDVIFSSLRDGGFHLFRKPANGTGAAVRLERAEDARPTERFPSSVSPDGKFLVFREGATAGFDLGILPLDEPQDARLLLSSDFAELHGAISPDGRWLAYASDESGQREVYVRPFPNVDSGRWHVSAGGGESPVWSRTTRELFYRVRGFPASAMMAVSYQANDEGFRASAPELLFESEHVFGASGRNYDVTPDGQRFLMIKAAPSDRSVDGASQVVVVLNFDEELKRRVPIH